MFTDESCFTVRPIKHYLRVLRRNGRRLSFKQIFSTYKSGYQSVSVWGGFSLRGRTPLVGTVGSFDNSAYPVIINNHILPFMYDVHDGSESFILQEDNCGPHRANRIATYLANEEVTRMKWPPREPWFESYWKRVGAHENASTQTCFASKKSDAFISHFEWHLE